MTRAHGRPRSPDSRFPGPVEEKAGPTKADTPGKSAVVRNSPE